MIAAVLATAVSLVVSAPPPRVGLSVAPSHLALQAGEGAMVHVSAPARLVLHAAVAGLTLDARGRPQIIGKRDAANWLVLSPRTLLVGPGGATLRVRSRRADGARAGDHSALVLLSAATPTGKGVVVAMRVGLVVTVRVGGRSVRRLEVADVRARRAGRAAVIEVTLSNRGDVIERLDAGRLEVTLRRGARIVARLHYLRRWLLPRTSTVIRLRCRGALHRTVVARVALAGTGARTYRLRL